MELFELTDKVAKGEEALMPVKKEAEKKNSGGSSNMGDRKRGPQSVSAADASGSSKK